MPAHVTVPDQATVTTYSVTTSQSVFSFPWTVFAKADIRIRVGSTELAQSAFTFTGTPGTEGGFAGGTVTLNTAVSSTTVRIWRQVIPARTGDFGAGPVATRDLNTELDRLTAMNQDAKRDGESAVRVPLGEPGLTLPAASARAGGLQGYDASGAPIIVSSDLPEIVALVDEAVAAADQASTSATNASDASTVATAAAASSTSSAASAAVSATDAQAAAANVASFSIGGTLYYPAALANVPRGATSATITAAGSGGTNGTFALAFSGGNLSVNPTGTFTVSGGAVTAVSITGPGLYVGASITLPTVSLAASSGLTGATVTLNAGFLVASGQTYWTDHATDPTLYQGVQNAAGTATPLTGVTLLKQGVSVPDLPSWYRNMRSAVGIGALRCLFHADGPVTFHNGGPAITQLRSLDPTPFSLNLTSTLSSWADPRPIRQAQGIYLNSETGMDGSFSVLPSSAAGMGVLYACQLPTADQTVNNRTLLAGGNEGDIKLVSGERRTTFTPDVPDPANILFQATELVDGIFVRRNGSWTASNSYGNFRLLTLYNSANTSYLGVELNHLGQIRVLAFSGSGEIADITMSGLSVLGRDNLVIGVYRNQNTLELWVDGAAVAVFDVTLQAAYAFDRVWINSSSRQLAPVIAIGGGGFRHWFKGFGTVNNVFQNQWPRVLAEFANGFGGRTVENKPKIYGVMQLGQSWAEASTLVTHPLPGAWNGTVARAAPNSGENAAITRVVNREVLGQGPRGSSAETLIGPMNPVFNGLGTILSTASPGFEAGEGTFPSAFSRLFVGLQNFAARSRKFFLTRTYAGGAPIDYLFAEPVVRPIDTLKTATLGGDEVFAAAVRRLIIARDEFAARGEQLVIENVVFEHGHSQSIIDVNGGYTAQVAAAYDKMNAAIRQVTGQASDPIWFMPQVTHGGDQALPANITNLGITGAFSTVDQQILDAENIGGRRIFVCGPAYPYTTAIHNYRAGYLCRGEMIGDAMRRVTLEGVTPIKLAPTTITRSGNNIDITYPLLPNRQLRFVPVGPNPYTIPATATDSGVNTQGFAYARRRAIVSVTAGTPAVVSWTAHGLVNGDRVRFVTYGSGSPMPTGLSACVDYFVVNATTNAFNVAATSGGAAINTTGSTLASVACYDTTVKIQSVSITNATAGTVRITLDAPAVAGGLVQCVGFNSHYSNLCDGPITGGETLGFRRDQDWTQTLNGDGSIPYAVGLLNDLRFWACAFSRVLS
jgi:hypothetical protein